MHGYTDQKADYRRRLARIEGQVRGLQRMIDEDVYCIDILVQVSAATRALQGVALGLLDEHVRHCVRDAITAGDVEGEEKITEALRAVERLVKS
jgi:CsoR family transcriptional regulator, copper-sensing transcriptional repressor